MEEGQSLRKEGSACNFPDIEQLSDQTVSHNSTRNQKNQDHTRILKSMSDYDVLSDVAESQRGGFDIPPEFELSDKLVVKKMDPTGYELKAQWYVGRSEAPD